jgi:LTXXQ motif family protein
MSASKALRFVHPFSAPSPVAGSKLAKLGNPMPALKTGMGIAAMLLLIVPLITVAADARGGGGGGGHGGGGGGHGGGGGGHGGGGGGHGGGFGGHSGGFARHGGGFAGRGGGLGIGTRSLQGARVGGLRGGARSRGVGRSISSPRAGIATARVGGTGNRFATAPARNLGVAGTHLRGANLGRGVFGNRAIGNVALRSHFASARFQGRFFGSRWPWWRGGLVVGWIGPVFWPYADYDFFDYVYWPYAYDDFWPYAYDDVYYGIYGSYAYAGGLSAPGRNGSSAPRRTARARGALERRAAEVCTNNASELTDSPIERIFEIVQPTDAQRPALDELRAANAQAIDILKAGCPNDLPSTPTGRVAAMESRLQVMLQAVQTVRPALNRFYQSLNDEQKARFNAVSLGDDSTTGEDRRDFTKFCDERTPGVTDLPIDRIAQAVQPTSVQRVALDELKDASTKAAEALKANCPSYQALTPTGRVEAMEKRLQATLGAVRTVQPALTKFYDGLSDEQKARFNSLRSASRPVG